MIKNNKSKNVEICKVAHVMCVQNFVQNFYLGR